MDTEIVNYIERCGIYRFADAIAHARRSASESGPRELTLREAWQLAKQLQVAL